MTPRIAPLANPSDEVVAFYDKARLRGPDGSAFNIWATVANHPDLLKRWSVFAVHVLAKSTLAPRDRELLILRAGAVCSSRYEFAQHAMIARGCGLSDDEIARVKVGPEDPAWSEQDRDLLRAVDELHAASRIADRTWEALAKRFSIEQLLDLIFTVGQYHLVSYVLNSCDVDLDQGVPDVL